MLFASKISLKKSSHC